MAAEGLAACGRPMGDCVDCNACVVVCPAGMIFVKVSRWSDYLRVVH